MNTSGNKILIHIDDDPNTQRAVKETLHEEFDHIISCDSFTQFNAVLLKMTAETRSQIDAIITDISIRDGDLTRGMPILQLIQRTLTIAKMLTPFIIYSGSGGSKTLRIMLKHLENSAENWAIEKEREGEVPENFKEYILAFVEESKKKEPKTSEYQYKIANQG